MSNICSKRTSISPRLVTLTELMFQIIDIRIFKKSPWKSFRKSSWCYLGPLFYLLVSSLLSLHLPHTHSLSITHTPFLSHTHIIHARKNTSTNAISPRQTLVFYRFICTAMACTPKRAPFHRPPPCTAFFSQYFNSLHIDTFVCRSATNAWVSAGVCVRVCRVSCCWSGRHKAGKLADELRPNGRQPPPTTDAWCGAEWGPALSWLVACPCCDSPADLYSTV